jgi:acyl dehydratase
MTLADKTQIESLGEQKIKPAALMELRERIGVPLRHLQRDVIVTPEWIERYAFAIADTNPLWSDPIYAARGPQGRLTAPPSMIYVLSGWDIGSGLPGVHAMYVRSRVEWFRPILEGDRLKSSGAMHEVTEREGRFAGYSVLQGVKIDYRDDDDKLVCVAQHWNLRTERGEARRRSEGKKPEPKTYTHEEITQIETQVFREVTRGDIARNWSDVEIGEDLPEVVKGPLTVTDMIGYMRGGFTGISGGFFMYTHGTAAAFRRRHPHAVIVNSSGVPDSPEAVHWDDRLAQKSGVAAAYDMGPQRIGWMTQLVTNWIGDTGFLKLIDIKLGQVVLMGDTTWCTGKVIAKERVDNDNLVTIELQARNQRDEVVARGEAIAVLPN